MSNVKVPFKTKMSRMGLLGKKYAPEIFLGLGSLGFLGSMALAAIATLKLEPIIDEAKGQLKEVKINQEALEESGTYKKELSNVYIKSSLKVARLYLPTATVATLSLGLIFASHGLLSRRNLAIMGAYTTLEKSFSNYREQVVDEFGNDVDNQFRYGMKKEKVDVEYIDEKTGKTKTKKEEIIVVDPNIIAGYSPYARYFNEVNNNYENDASYNLLFLRNAQNYANDKLRTQGHIFLNEVYDLLGFDRSREGALVGWVFDLNDECRDNFVDIGIYDISLKSSQDFVNGYEKSILLDFNVDGIIYDMI